MLTFEHGGIERETLIHTNLGFMGFETRSGFQSHKNGEFTVIN